jgi:zinc protease
MLLLAIGLALSCGSKPPKAAGEPAAPKPAASLRLRDFRFKSGLRVIGEEDSNAPVVGVVNVVGSGANGDPPGKEGLAHLVEHLTYRSKRSERTMWSLFQQAGAGRSNASTHHDSTVYWEFGPRDTLLDLLILEASRMSDPLGGVDEEIFKVEREVVRNELRQRGETVIDGAVWGALSKATYPENHPYSRPVVGTHQSLDRLTLADAREFVQKRYRPANMTMVVAGDFQLERLGKLLGEALPASLVDAAPDANLATARLAVHDDEPPEPPPAKGIVTIEGMVTAPELYLAWSLPPNYGPASHFAQLAIGGLHGAISHAAGTDNDVIDGSAQLIPGVQASTVIAQVTLREGSHPERSAEIVLNGLVENWLTDATPQEHQLGFGQRIGRSATLMMIESEDITDRAVERAAFVHFTGDLAYLSKRLQALGTMDPSKLEGFYSRYLNRDRARAVLVRPIPKDRVATLGHVGIGEAKDTSTPAQYDLKTLRKLAVNPHLDVNFQSRRLKNGLFVEAARHGTAPLVTIGLTLRGGLAEEPESGVAKIAWSLASAKRPLHGWLSEYGALGGRSATTDGMTFRMRVLSKHLARILPIFEDYVTSLEVRSDAYAQFERYELDYLRRDQQRPEFVSNRDFRLALFGSHPFGNVSQIPPKSVPSRSALNAWLATQVTPARATLAIVGDLDPEEALNAAEDAFGGWKGNAGAPDPEPLTPTSAHSAIVVHRPAATQAVVRLGCRLPSTDATQIVAARIVSIALAQRIGNVRQQRGTTYGLSSHVEVLRGGTAVLHIDGAIENAGLASALRTIRNEMTTLAVSNGADINRARWTLASQFNLELVTSEDWMKHALEAARNSWSLQSIDKVPEVIASVDTSNVLSALRSCSNDGVLSIVGDETIARRAIKDVWPTTKQERRASVPPP